MAGRLLFFEDGHALVGAGSTQHLEILLQRAAQRLLRADLVIDDEDGRQFAQAGRKAHCRNFPVEITVPGQMARRPGMRVNARRNDSARHGRRGRSRRNCGAFPSVLPHDRRPAASRPHRRHAWRCFAARRSPIVRRAASSAARRATSTENPARAGRRRRKPSLHRLSLPSSASDGA
jgi:hypothetical protein